MSAARAQTCFMLDTISLDTTQRKPKLNTPFNKLPLVPNLPPQMPLTGASAILPLVPANQFLVRDYNSVDADQAHGGTEIEDIITSAYDTKGFKS